MKFAVCMTAAFLAALSWADDVDDLIRKEMDARRIPGMSVLITKDDKLIKRAAYGKADLELDVPMTVHHVMESGSIGKTFTATVIFQLIEEGKLNLSDTLGKRLKDCPEPWKDLTLQMLLSHSSGLPDYAGVPGLGLIEKWEKADWFKKMPTLPFDFAPGTQFAYSNSNYWLLGFVAEEAGGKPILELVQARIFDKLGLKHSYVADELAIIPHRAKGYLRNGPTLLNGPSIAPGYGDGSLINSCEDLAALEKGLREGKLLKPETVAQMQTAHRLPNGRKTGYGYGWFVREVNKIKLVSHGGNTAGYFASLFRVPTKGLTIVVEGNIHDVGGDGVAQKIAELYVPELRYVKLPEAQDPDPKATAQRLDVIKSLAARTPNEELIDPDMSARLKTGRGQMAMGSFARFKDLGKLAYLGTEADDPDTVVKYRGELNGKTYLFTFTITKAGKVYSVGHREE
ncbi:MAG: D-aminopeptidase [Fimbriimonadaceae bacterium]|nr:D-aminopeptidase [Fimbriimonadaceae bacterium]